MARMITYKSKDIREHDTDTLLYLLGWIAARQRYRSACGIRDGAAYAEECAMDDAVRTELERRDIK